MLGLVCASAAPIAPEGCQQHVTAHGLLLGKGLMQRCCQLKAHLKSNVACMYQGCRTCCTTDPIGLTLTSCCCRTMSVDVHGAAWVASQQGTITILEANSLRKSAGSAVLTMTVRYQLTQSGVVQAAGSEGVSACSIRIAPSMVHATPAAACVVYAPLLWHLKPI